MEQREARVAVKMYVDRPPCPDGVEIELPFVRDARRGQVTFVIRREVRDVPKQ